MPLFHRMTQKCMYTAVLSIEKSFQNPYLAAGDGRAENEFRVGEQVNYQVTVNNLQKGSIARNLVISDLSLPEGLALDGAEDAVTVSGVPAVIQNPVAGTDDAGNQLNPENYKETVEKTSQLSGYTSGNRMDRDDFRSSVSDTCDC